MHAVSTKTMVLIAIFGIGYMFFIISKTARRQLDIYELIMLSMVAIVPIAFVSFPEFAYWLSKVTGVEFPFVVMFGTLFAILFVFVHRQSLKLHKLEQCNRLLVQELSLLRQACEQADIGRYRDIQVRSIK